MIGSLYTGISGLSANSKAMSVIGDNIANVNTSAFKSNRASFANILSKSLGGSSSNEIGRGVQMLGSSTLWTQGSLENTTSPTDFAINGRGFFVTKDESGSEFYTRSGNFIFDKDGKLVNSDGLVVQGYTIDDNGTMGSVSDIVVSSGSSPPIATNEMSINLNLNADSILPNAASLTISGSDPLSGVTFSALNEGTDGNAISVSYVDPGVVNASVGVSVTGNEIVITLANDGSGITSTAADIETAINSDPNASLLVNATAAGSGLVEAKAAQNLEGGTNPSTYSTTITVYDSLGSAVPVTIDFERNDLDSWTWSASIPDSAGNCTATGVLQFAENGELDPAGSGGTNPVIQITDLATGAEDLVIDWKIMDDNQNLTNGTLTGYAAQSITTFGSQNGYPPGTLQSTQIDEQGIVTGVYSNGQLKPLYRIVLADFLSYQGLDGVGKNLYQESLSSGEAMLGTPGNGRLGAITPKALEMSNVDLATEFVKMITTQRAFQANSRVITTSDEILSELINLKR